MIYFIIYVNMFWRKFLLKSIQRGLNIKSKSFSKYFKGSLQISYLKVTFKVISAYAADLLNIFLCNWSKVYVLIYLYYMKTWIYLQWKCTFLIIAALKINRHNFILNLSTIYCFVTIYQVDICLTRTYKENKFQSEVV